jgi:hypothetical protein
VEEAITTINQPMDFPAATISSQGFMTKVEFFSGSHRGEEVYLQDAELSTGDDGRFEVIEAALEKVS